MTADADVDARGLKCPWPALRAARAMRTRESVVIVADDPMAESELSSLAEECGWAMAPISTHFGPGFRLSR
ncbi:MAG: sulfurtransferase TusA family protein [Sphingomonadaceae bacterium]|nr:sulfurtransferase TusA family protein [Sphingomonadaceae bacterium]